MVVPLHCRMSVRCIGKIPTFTLHFCANFHTKKFETFYSQIFFFYVIRQYNGTKVTERHFRLTHSKNIEWKLHICQCNSSWTRPNSTLKKRLLVDLCKAKHCRIYKPLYLELNRHRQVASKLGANESLAQLEGFLQYCNIYISRLINYNQTN